MIFWTKLLTAAHAATTSIHPYLCLYYMHRLGFDFLAISLLTAFVMLLKLPASAFWIDLVDHRPSLHGVLTGLLTAIGTAGILLILSVPPTPFLLPIVILSCILDGLFYQPLEVLIDSAIIKILGDYKVLYANERQYGKIISAIMTIGIGWSLDDDHDFDTLMVTLLIGSVILFLLSLSTTVQPADPTLLGIQDEQSPLLPDYYKPYSLFKEHLSHISEEDPSLLQRMATNQSKPLPRPTSLLSELSYATQSIRVGKSHPVWDDHLPPSFELARLPYPPPQAPAIVLITLMPGYTHCPEINHSKWMVRSFVSSIFCLGMAYGMTQPLLYLYLHDTLGFPMHTLGLMGCMTIMADYLAHYLVLKVIHDGHLPVMVVMAHLILTVCTLSYTQLQPGGAFSTQLWAIVLQSLFALAMHAIWLIAAHQVDSVVLIGHERMMLKGTMAACYSSLGPTLGLLLTGYLVHGSYFYAALLSLISGILSWSYL